MIHSMTGYNRAKGQTRLGELQIELRGVNGRFLDVKVRTPRFLFILESRLQEAVRSRLERGRVECGLTLNGGAASGCSLKVNERMAEAYLQVAEQLRTQFRLVGAPTTEFLLRIPEVVCLEDPAIEPDELWSEVEPILAKALDGFCAMRRREGEALAKELSGRLGNVERCADKVDELRAEVVQLCRERIQARLKELFEDVKVDEGRLIQEVALMSERSDITEEVVRLRSHLKQFASLISAERSVGRKMDFLLQEMLREVNTIGSKTDLLAIVQQVLEMKNEVEKLREQVQNIE